MLCTIARALPPTDVTHASHPGAPLHGAPRPTAAAEAALVCTTREDLRRLRAVVAARATAAGLPPARARDLVLAAHEVAANAHLHGGGSATLTTWTADGCFLCEVADRGDGIADPQAGTVPPPPTQVGGRGLWLARQLCDQVQVRTGAGGTVVRLRLSL